MAKLKNNTEVSPTKVSDISIPLPKEEMALLRKSLPQGAVGEICKRTGFKANYIYLIFRADTDYNDAAKDVVATALAIIKEAKDAKDALANKISETISENK